MPRRRSPKRRVIVLTASIGGAHAAVGDAVARYLRSRHAETVEVSVVDFLERFAPGLNVLAKFAYQQTADFFPSTRATFGELSRTMPSNPVVHELSRGVVTAVAAALAETRADAVISTFPLAAAAVSEAKNGSAVFSACVIPDWSAHRVWLHPDTDLHFVACKEAREDLVVAGTPWDRVVVSGIPVAERLEEKVSPDECRRSLGLADRFTVLLGAGGDAKQIAARFAAVGIQVAVDAGSNTRLRERIDKLAASEALVHAYGLGTDARRMIGAADVFVTSASGSALPEAMVTGMPAIVNGAVPAQEVHNVDFLVNCGAALQARDEEDVVDKVRFLSSHPERLAQLAADAATVGRSGGAQTVAERVVASLR